MVVVSEQWDLLSPSNSSLAQDWSPPLLSIPPCSQGSPSAVGRACRSSFLQTAFPAGREPPLRRQASQSSVKESHPGDLPSSLLCSWVQACQVLETPLWAT